MAETMHHKGYHIWSLFLISVPSKVTPVPIEMHLPEFLSISFAHILLVRFRL